MQTIVKTLLLLAATFAAISCTAADSDLLKAGQAVAPASAARVYPKIVLYSVAWCPHCKEAREYLAARKIPFILLDVDQDERAMETLLNHYDTNKVPLIVIGDDAAVLNGFNPDDFEQALRNIMGH